jgi:hypothetical protein
MNTSLHYTFRSVKIRFTPDEVREAIVADDYSLWSSDDIERLVDAVAPYEFVGTGLGVDGALDDAYRRMLDVLNVLYRFVAV